MEPTPSAAPHNAPVVPPRRPLAQPQVGPPVPPGVIAPPTPVVAKAIDIPASEKTIDEATGAAAVKLSFWQHPFTQKVMPLLSSILIHAAIILIGWLLIDTIKRAGEPTKEQFIVPDAAIADGPEGGVLHPGINGDDTRDSAQDKMQVDTQGIAEQKNAESLAQTLGGGENDASADPLKSGPMSDVSKGHSTGTGAGDSAGGGNGEAGGPMAAFGVPGGGGGVGAKAKFVGVSGHANRIVFVLDATGSMMQEFDSLRVEVRKAIDILQPPQSFNVVFIQDNAPPPPSPTLLFTTPDNKTLVKNYVNNFTPRGGTNPLPALQKAFEMKPELIYFLIDPSDFPDKQAVIDLVHKNANGGKVKMNIIAFEGHDADNEAFLGNLAKETGGQFKFLSAKDLEGAN